MRPNSSVRSLTFLAAVLLLLSCFPGLAALRLPRVFSSHMVLQQEKPIIVWGWAEPNEKITVRLSTATQETTANAKGEWKLTLPPQKAGGPFVMTIAGKEEIKFNDVMIGEVWLCSGQSNMEMGIASVKDAKEEIAAAKYSRIRLLMVPNNWTADPQQDIKESQWEVCSPGSIAKGGWGGFSATAYFFGRELHKTLGVAVGLIDADWGGTRIESWTPPEGFAQVPELKQQSETVQLGLATSTSHHEKLESVISSTDAWVKDARTALQNNTQPPAMPQYPVDLGGPRDVQAPTALFNGMIYPVHPFAIRGAIWYQGESNLGDGKFYAERMKALIGGWRQIWDEGEFPFYFVQIAPYNYGGQPERMGDFWQAQDSIQDSVPNTGMAVINDIGDLKDIHPKDKQNVGHRLALLALAKTYGKTDLAYSGPRFKKLQVEGDKLRVSFEHADGLATRDGKEPSWFEIIDRDEGGWVKANARIEGETVVLTSTSAPHPVAVRFAWSMLVEPNLVNAAKLPTGAFRAGDVPKRDALSMYVPETKEYQVIYDLDLNTLGPRLKYQVDKAESFKGKFDRIAYYMELGKANEEPQFAFVSMDAFTDDVKKIGVPTAQSGASFQRNVAHMNVYSNAKDVMNGTNLAGGNIEFWPNNYGAANSSKVPNASNDIYDFGDQPSDPTDGYGSMQVHNHDAKQTIFALNHWREAKKADVGLGNQPQGQQDWTFASNGDQYTLKRLRVFVRPK